MTKGFQHLLLIVFYMGLLFCPEKLKSQNWPAADSQANLMNDLLIVDYWNRRLSDRLPVAYNHLLQGGYFAMPSARMGPDGEIGIGYSHTPPYRNYNLRCQILPCLEVTGNYRIFKGIDDPVLTPLGFGDFSDKGANFKLALFRPEDSEYKLPGLAIGYEDFMGTRAFHARYIVFTHVFLKQNLEASLGYGAGRIKGFFGGINWLPFRNVSRWKFLQSLSLAAEYDATPYHQEHIEKHPDGRTSRSPINFGVKYRLCDYFDLSLSYIRGDALAFSASAFYNFGYTKGFLPKIDDPLPYATPINIEALSARRPEDVFVQEMIFAFREQGFDVLDIMLTSNCHCQKGLRFNVLNETFRLENQVRERLNNLLAYLMPADIEEVVVVIYSEGFSIQEYHFQMDSVRQFAAREIGPFELKILSPLREVSLPDACSTTRLFSRRRGLFNFELSPRTYTFFGSATGKFKYSAGLNAAFNGFLQKDVYYSILLGYTLFDDIGSFNDFDRLNPSQLINVRTDVIRYYQQRGITVEEAYLQKTWNLGRGWYSRLSGGYFEVEYGGAATEFLYYPLRSCWAVGIEGAVLKKRTYSGLGFTNKIRKLDGFVPTFRHFLGSQYFLNLYYDWKRAHMDFKISIGKFLANDSGVRYEVSRYFPSGLRLTLWYTHTNGHDKINGETYYDKGVAFTLPFDVFYTHSERTRWYYGMSAWMRDVGVRACTGMRLFELINDQRQSY